MKRLSLYKTRAIVLLRKALGERDKLAILYTSRFGKLESQAKGAQRIRSRFSGALEPFSLIDVSLWIGDYTSIVRESKIIRSFLPLREDIERIKVASFITKTTNSLVGLSYPDYSIFQLLLHTFVWLEERCDFLIKPFFIFKLLKILGVFPSFSKCICCEEKEVFGLNPKIGGLTCKKHIDDGMPISAPVIKIIESLSRIPFFLARRISLAKSVRKEIEEISQSLIFMHLPRAPTSYFHLSN